MGGGGVTQIFELTFSICSAIRLFHSHKKKLTHLLAGVLTGRHPSTRLSLFTFFPLPHWVVLFSEPSPEKKKTDLRSNILCSVNCLSSFVHGRCRSPVVACQRKLCVDIPREGLCGVHQRRNSEEEILMAFTVAKFGEELFIAFVSGEILRGTLHGFHQWRNSEGKFSWRSSVAKFREKVFVAFISGKIPKMKQTFHGVHQW